MLLTLADFDYTLPVDLIAQVPLPQRSASRLLVVEGGLRQDSVFVDLPQRLRAGDLLVLNDSRVLHARLLGHKESGGRIEILVERLLDHATVLAQLRASKPPQPGTRLRLEDAFDVEVLGRDGEFYRLQFSGDAAELVERHGRLPLPPYIERVAGAPDEERYQTVYAREKGSVAAPTAGLHFDGDLFSRLRGKGVEIAHVTLHVGAGTFQPVRVSDLAQHRMHTERYHLPQATADAIAATRARGGRIVAVGTTSLRVLESAALDGNVKVGAGETALFVTPGFEFRIVDILITNFHLPKSTLLMLVAAFAGMEEIRAAYQHAIAARYRFFSYGDAMLLRRRPRE
ncbi:MAG: tRNA preQ1(34) S-adenosylmethionine ribosyltransferase-isomerase QueA [Sulfuritalea sp.]|jgi:S-adenosylmethionine:tRNA ribosyltransferase-isomerase|nr:tRNA preQ1(34) S-adenosylmethionine ribosyltransferase-isomerase QueA [Sulfuritalea sp.]